MSSKRRVLLGVIPLSVVLLAGCGQKYQAVCGADGRVYRIDTQSGEVVPIGAPLPAMPTNSIGAKEPQPARFQLVLGTVRYFSVDYRVEDAPSIFKIDSVTGRTWRYFRSIQSDSEMWLEFTNSNVPPK